MKCRSVCVFGIAACCLSCQLVQYEVTMKSSFTAISGEKCHLTEVYNYQFIKFHPLVLRTVVFLKVYCCYYF